MLYILLASPRLVSPSQLHSALSAGLSLAIAPGPHTGRSLPANYVSKVSPRKSRRAGLSPPSRAGLSPLIAPGRRYQDGAPR